MGGFVTTKKTAAVAPGMNTVGDYLDASVRSNTRRSYASAITHFEVEWGGMLPATAATLARYLAAYGGVLSINTLKHRLAGIAKWHAEQGFPDPTKAPIVRKVLKGIQTLHPKLEKQAVPLQISQLEIVVRKLDVLTQESLTNGDVASALRRTRDKAFLLIGFWRGFRGDEMKRLRIEHVQVAPAKWLDCYLPYTKGDRAMLGRHFKVPALKILCPVSAYTDWIALSGLTKGPVFRKIDRWGKIGEEGLHANSLIPLLRRTFSVAGLESANDFSGHSLRRGFAAWASKNGWDIKTVMNYVGWKDVKSAMRYLDGEDPFESYRQTISNHGGVLEE